MNNSRGVDDFQRDPRDNAAGNADQISGEFRNVDRQGDRAREP